MESGEIKVPVGMSMLEAAHENDIELEGSFNIILYTSILSVATYDLWLISSKMIAGACEGSLACSTCHVVVMVCCYTLNRLHLLLVVDE